MLNSCGVTLFLMESSQGFGRRIARLRPGSTRTTVVAVATSRRLPQAVAIEAAGSFRPDENCLHNEPTRPLISYFDDEREREREPVG